jgi:hypothetical protein
MYVTCPHCGMKLNASADVAGRVVECSQCNRRFTVPEPTAIPVPPPVSNSASGGTKYDFGTNPRASATDDFFSSSNPVDAVVPPRRIRRSKSKNSNTIVWGVIGAGVFLVVLIAWISANGWANNPNRVQFVGQSDFDHGNAVEDFSRSLFYLIFGVPFYFMPTIVAIIRKHQNAPAIAILNFLVGWTGIGWIVSIVWAFTESRSRDHHHYHYHETPPDL